MLQRPLLYIYIPYRNQLCALSRDQRDIALPVPAKPPMCRLSVSCVSTHTHTHTRLCIKHLAVGWIIAETQCLNNILGFIDMYALNSLRRAATYS